MDTVELFGTAASVVVAVSLTMRNIKRLRVINGIGAVGFAAYGAFIGSLPVLALNAFIALIDLYYLARMRSTRDSFGSIEGDPAGWAYLAQFLDFYRRDIARYAPDFALGAADFALDAAGPWRAEFILRDMVPVALVIFRKRSEVEVEIALDYAVPSHRDFKSAEYYFTKAAERIAAGRELVFVERTSVPAHARYLERLGFEAAPRAASSAAPSDAAPAGAPVEYRKRIRGR